MADLGDHCRRHRATFNGKIAQSTGVPEQHRQLFNFQGGRTTQKDAPQAPVEIGNRKIDCDVTLTISQKGVCWPASLRKRTNGFIVPHAAPPTEP